jgi:hypothetical protein
VSRVPAEEAATALAPHLKAQHLIKFATYLEAVGARMYAKQSKKKCAECGTALEHKIVDGREMRLLFVRADACYCSARCKQKAYRKRRVTAAHSPLRSSASHDTALPDAENI